MKKFLAIALIALSAATGIASVARADYFGNDKRTLEGQLLDGIFGQIEKNGI